jgi:hypothetical protein
MSLDAINDLMASFAIMPAELLRRERIVYPDGALVEMVVWRVPRYKYSLAYIVGGKRVLGYDNERGKGDHRHFGGIEESVTFTSIRALVDRFVGEVEALRGELP